MLSKPSAESSAGKSRSARNSNAQQIADRVGVFVAIQTMRRHASGIGLRPTHRRARTRARCSRSSPSSARGIGTSSARRRHVAGAQAAKNRFPHVAMLDERFRRRQAGHAHAAGRTLLAVALHARLRQDRTDGACRTRRLHRWRASLGEAGRHYVRPGR